MKFLYDYFPILCFFIAYKLFGIFTATAVTMVASVLQVGIYWLKYRRFEKLHIITLLFVLILGGSTLIFHKVIFIKWKPTIIYWIFAIVLAVSQFIGRRPLLHRMLADKISLPDKIWQRLNISWAIFFAALGALNIYVVYHMNTNAWVNFKMFGTLGITLVFIIAQGLYMAKYMDPNKSITAKK